MSCRGPAERPDSTTTFRRHPVASYYALAWTWLVELSLAGTKQGWISLKIPFAVHYLVSLGPAVAAVVVTASTSGSTGLCELWGRITQWRAGRQWKV